MTIIRPDLIDVMPYASARRDKVSGYIWLNANELPWQQADNINRYPSPQPTPLIQAMAPFYQVDDDQIVVSCGSDSAIDLLVRLCCLPGQNAIIQCPPTFGMYAISSRLHGVDCIDVPLQGDDFQLNKQALLDAYTPHVKLVFLCSPNNPTGNLMDEKAIVEICQQLAGQALVVVDEAYIEFSQRDSISRYLPHNPNLVVLRTLSKAFGLAGARVGALLAHRDLVVALAKVLPPYPLPTPSIALAQQQFSPASLALMKKRVAIIVQARQRLLAALTQSPLFEKVWPSQTNFILLQSRKPIAQRLLKHGIVVRAFNRGFAAAEVCRITVGTEQENRAVLEALQQLAGE